MNTSITRFELPAGVPTDAIKKGFLEVAPRFKEPAGLLRKYFLISQDGKTGGGVYLWNSAEQARSFSEGVLRPMIKEKFQVEPSIEYYDAPAVVDNITSEIVLNAPERASRTGDSQNGGSLPGEKSLARRDDCVRASSSTGKSGARENRDGRRRGAAFPLLV